MVFALGVWATALPLPAQEGFESFPLVQIGENLHQTEHCLFIVENDGQVAWPEAGSVFSPANLARYFTILSTRFPGTYTSVCFMANNLTPASGPAYVTRTYKADGINGPGTPGAPQSFDSVDYCRYDLGEDPVIPGCLEGFDREIGHAWGVWVLNPDAGHWRDASTVDCQLGGGTRSASSFLVKKIYGNPVSGFRWRGMDIRQSDDLQTYSEQQLYLMGLQPALPTFHVLNNPVFNPDHTLGYDSIATFDHAALLASQGPRNPDFRQSPKHFKVGFVYIARDVMEISTVAWGVESSVDHFCNAEEIDSFRYPAQVPFLCASRYRAHVDGRLSDLDGNKRPQLTITDSYTSSNDGTATVRFTAGDPDGPAPSVVLVPSSGSCTIQGSTVQIEGLPNGAHFFTLKAQDAGGKHVFGHFVVEVLRPATAVSFTSQPADQTVTAGAAASFTVAASGSPASLHWYLQAAGTSTWNELSEGHGYAGTATSTLTVTTTVGMDGDRFLCVANNGAASSEVATLVVTEQLPIVTAYYTERTLVLGRDTEAVFVVGGGEPPAVTGYFTYQWQCKPAATGVWGDVVEGDDTVGFTARDSKTNGLTVYLRSVAQDGDQYRCIVSNSSGSVTSAAKTLIVCEAPRAVVSPAEITASPGGSATFSVVATGTPPFTYQWFKSGSPIAGATSASLTFANVKQADEGQYSVVVRGTVESDPASCYLRVPIRYPVPTIVTPPANATVKTGGQATFVVRASGYRATYVWQRKPAATGLWDNVVAGSQFASTREQLWVTGATLEMSGDQYRCRINDWGGTVTSPAATLTVLAPPAISTQPTSVTVATGSTATFTVVASGGAPLSYQWYQNNTPVSAGTAATLSLAKVQAANAGTYSVKITNPVGSVSSSAVSLAVLAPPAVTTQPKSAVVNAGAAVSFSVLATGGAPLTYQWRKNGIAIAGATSATYAIPSAKATDAGSFTVVVANKVGSVTSANAGLTVNVAPTITAQPKAVSVANGKSASFTVAATGTAPLTYQWKKNGTSIAGATSASYAIPSAKTTDAGNYSVVVANKVGSVTSANAGLTVNVAPTITSQPKAVSVANGKSASFSVAATGTAPLTYQWKKNGTAIAGATAAAYTIPSAKTTDAGTYSVVLTNAAGTVTSTAAALTVK